MFLYVSLVNVNYYEDKLSNVLNYFWCITKTQEHSWKNNYSDQTYYVNSKEYMGYLNQQPEQLHQNLSRAESTRLH